MTDMAEMAKANEEKIRSEIPTEKVTSAFIKAGAGAGKTSLLVERIYQQLVRGVAPARIAAITFTNKAANEMYERISQKLQQKEAELGPGEEREKVSGARREMEEMRISTIHSFCRTIVEEFPFLAGLSMDAVELENAEVAARQSKFLSDFLMECKELEALQGKKTLRLYNEQFSDNVKSVKKKMSGAFAEKESAKYIYDLCSLNSRAGLLGRKLEGVLSQREGDLPAVDCAAVEKETTLLLRDAKKWLEDIFSGLDAELRSLVNRPDTKSSSRTKFLNILSGLANDDVGNLKAFLKESSAKRLAELWSRRDAVETVEEVLFFSNAHKTQKWIESMFEGTKEQEPLQNWWNGNKQQYKADLEKLLERYVELRHRVVLGFCGELMRSYLAYEDQEKIIGNHNIVYRALRIVRNDKAVARTIAERFDTIYIDEYQDTDAQQAEFFQRLWEASDGGLNLFYIGDAKQSIYAFRGADPRQFNNQEEQFRRAEEEKTDSRRVFELHFNYRSNKAVCEWVNEEFKEDYPGEDMMAMSPSKKSDDRQLYGVYRYPLKSEMLLAEKDAKGAEKRAEATEKRAEETAELICDLIRHQALVFDPGMAKRDGSDGLRPVRPSDFLLLFWRTDNMEIFQRALRKKGFPVCMDGRVHFSGNLAYQALISVLEYCLYGKKYYKYQALGFCPFLTEGELELLRRESKGMLPAAFVRGLLSDSRFFHNVWNREEALAGLYHAIEEAAQSEYADLGGFLKRLPRNKENNHTLSLKQGEDEGIRLMNIHKAKGLEGQIVVCCETHGERKSGGSEQDREQFRNLEYVMCTRAREALIFIGDCLPGSKEAGKLELQKFAAEGAEITEEVQGRSDGCGLRQAPADGTGDFQEHEGQRNPRVKRINPSLEKRKAQAEQQAVTTDGGDVLVAKADSTPEDAGDVQGAGKREYVKRPYGNRLGLVVHRVMELVVSERERLCALAERAEKDGETGMPDEMRRVVEPFLRFAVAEELTEPLLKRDCVELRLPEQDAGKSLEGDDGFLETVCDAVREYVFAFLYSVYSRQRYRYCIQNCEVYTELPFFVHRIGEDGGEETIHGIMDLVIKENADGRERYIVADYKTNRQMAGETEEEYQQRLCKTYDGQLALYKEILRELFQIPEETPIETVIISYYMK